MENTTDQGVDNIFTDELIKRCNPGLTDFGTGSVIALSSQCLRSAKQPTACTICIDACPVDAIRANTLQRPIITNDCLKCGYCISVCPLNSITATTRTIQQVIRLLLQATLRVDQLTITCSRSSALLRLEAEGSDPKAAQAALEHLIQAEANDSLYLIPCLAMLSRELWFTVLNEIGIAQVKEVLVLLPFGQCELCPVNCKGGAVDSFVDAIDTAEQWSRQTVTIISFANDVPVYQKATVRGFLSNENPADRRGIFTGFYKQLRRTLDDSSRTGNRAANEAVWMRERNETIARTLLADDLKPEITGSSKPLLAPFRQALVEAIGRNPDNADSVNLLVSQTDSMLCKGCELCVEVCPIKARAIENEKAYADPLYCLGCSACIQACPENACSFNRVSGRTFLRV